jgi:hypothetical protein
MEDFFSKPWWEFVGAFTGVVLGVIAILIARRQIKKKSLVYNVVYSSPLLTVASEIKEELKISYKGSPIQELNIFEIKFLNNGRDEIRKEDYEVPLEILFPNVKTFFSVEMSNCNPDDLKLLLHVEGSNKKVIVDPLLLNPGDFFTVKFLFNGESDNYKIFARIAGIKKIPLYEGNSSIYELLSKTNTFIIYSFCIITFIAWFIEKFVNSDSMFILSVIVTPIVIAICTLIFWPKDK